MSVSEGVKVLSYYQYMGPDSQTVYSTRHFCGDCRRGIGGVYGGACYGYPEYPEALEAKNETPMGLGEWSSRERERGQLEYYAFCPWCGVAFEDEWWKDRVIQNERTIDHYRNPGTHKGDTHEFRGDGPNCMAGHVLGSSDGSPCWCEPEIEPGIMGCVIRHQEKSYDEYLAKCERERKEAESEEDDEPDYDGYSW